MNAKSTFVPTCHVDKLMRIACTCPPPQSSLGSTNLTCKMWLARDHGDDVQQPPGFGVRLGVCHSGRFFDGSRIAYFVDYAANAAVPEGSQEETVGVVTANQSLQGLTIQSLSLNPKMTNHVKLTLLPSFRTVVQFR